MSSLTIFIPLVCDLKGEKEEGRGRKEGMEEGYTLCHYIVLVAFLPHCQYCIAKVFFCIT